ncbi:hypothetical protein [Micromonospora zamorensis]|uniref:hypothetical protein n=1 Tax=Micromonospora zamorensis TaxID=709883 RepID=UPI0033D69765
MVVAIAVGERGKGDAVEAADFTCENGAEGEDGGGDLMTEFGCFGPEPEHVSNLHGRDAVADGCADAACEVTVPAAAETPMMMAASIRLLTTPPRASPADQTASDISRNALLMADKDLSRSAVALAVVVK